MKKCFTLDLLLVFLLFSSSIHANDAVVTSPQAGTRTYAQNFKDMVLAECVATSYTKEPQATMDAGSSAGALQEWTKYDWELHPYNDLIPPLVKKYLARDYKNPVVESEIKGIRFDFLKCLDLYHSKELDLLIKRVVINPKNTYREDNSPSEKSK